MLRTNAEHKRSNRLWRLGSEELFETDKYTHVGIVCTKEMDMKDIEDLTRVLMFK